MLKLFCTKVAGITGFKGSDKIKKYRLKAIIFRFVFKIDRRLPTCFKIFVSFKIHVVSSASKRFPASFICYNIADVLLLLCMQPFAFFLVDNRLK